MEKPTPKENSRQENTAAIKTDTEHLLEQVLSKRNMTEAYKRVKANKGAAGIDGITMAKFDAYLTANWERIKAEIQAGTYRPQPVRRIEIPKPAGGKRKLGIPNILDRVIQQAMLQILSPIYEQDFSGSSYGFRPRRSAHQAVAKAREYIDEGYRYIVDIDLKEFFDTVPHDRLMARIARKIKDKRVLKLIRRYLQAGAMLYGVKTDTEQGTPQGGNLSPLLANIVLDELDKELESRGHKFCRYADDCNIYVKSKRAGDRVLKSVTAFIEQQLKLTVNDEKSGTRPFHQTKFLGFAFYRKQGGETGIWVANQTKKRIRKTFVKLTKRNRGHSIGRILLEVNQYGRGMVNYFRIADARSFFGDLEKWLRRRIRMYIWKQWKRGKTRYKNLRKLGLGHDLALQSAGSRKGYWRLAGSKGLTFTLTNKYLKELGLQNLNTKSSQLQLV